LKGYMQEITERAKADQQRNHPSRLDSLLEKASPQAIVKTLSRCLMYQDFDELIGLVGASEAKVLEEGVPQDLLAQLQDPEGKQAAREIAEAGVQTEGISASAAVQTEGTSASAAVQSWAAATSASAAVQATAQPQTPPRVVAIPPKVLAAWRESLGHVDGNEYHYIMDLRARLWKAILGGEAYDNDPEAITMREALTNRMSSLQWDRLRSQVCPLSFLSKWQWQEFCAWAA